MARSKSGRLYSFTEKPVKSLNGEHWNGRNILYWGMSKYKSITYENSPQKLVLENSEKPNNQVFKCPTCGWDTIYKEQLKRHITDQSCFDRERALGLLESIELEIPKDTIRNSETIAYELNELRQILGGE